MNEKNDEVITLCKIPKWNQKGYVMDIDGLCTTILATNYKMPPLILTEEKKCLMKIYNQN